MTKWLWLAKGLPPRNLLCQALNPRVKDSHDLLGCLPSESFDGDDLLRTLFWFMPLFIFFNDPKPSTAPHFSFQNGFLRNKLLFALVKTRVNIKRAAFI